MNIRYEHFNRCIIRTPLLPPSTLKDILTNDFTLSELIETYFRDPCIIEGIYLASPILHDELSKWYSDSKRNPAKERKLKVSFLKYLVRMSSRCTPFGIFAGCSVGSIGIETNIIRDYSNKQGRRTRIDMDFLLEYAQSVQNDRDFRRKLIFFPNSTMYRIGEEFRYIEFNEEEGRLEHQVVSVDANETLQFVVNNAVNGISLESLAKELMSGKDEENDIFNFLNRLIDNQFLISELLPVLSSEDYLQQIIDSVKRSDDRNEIMVKLLRQIDKELSLLDCKIGNDIDKYVRLIGYLNEINPTYDKDWVFQTDFYPVLKENSLSVEVIDKVRNAIHFIDSITTMNPPERLRKFKETFRERYDDQEIPLAIALDADIGILYAGGHNLSDSNILVDDLVLPNLEIDDGLKEFKLSEGECVLLKKITNPKNKDKRVIQFNKDEFSLNPTKEENMPDTMAAMIEIIGKGSNVQIHFIGAWGSSAANLIARFSHGNNDIESLVQEIVQKEQEANRDGIIAEIIHLPKKRMGNILLRPRLREYEIPYLANPIEPKRALKIDDLWLSIVNNELIIRSKKLKKRIIPQLTSAHNYRVDSLPIYHFLSDLQFQNSRAGIEFNLDNLLKFISYIPRVVFDGVIIIYATWVISKEQIKNLVNVGDDESLITESGKLQEALQLPQYVLLVEGDNELLINLKNVNSLHTLLSIVKGKEIFRFREFVYRIESGVESINQVVIPFYKNLYSDV